MANAQPAPPSGLRPMRPIKRVPFVEEDLPLTGPALLDPNDQSAAAAPAPAAASSFVTSAAPMPSLTGGGARVPSFASTLASAAPNVAALVSSHSAASALGAVAPALGALAPALGGAASAVSEIAAEAPAAAAFLSAPSAATALGVVSPALNAVPNVAQYANPLLQTVADHDLNPPFGAMADRIAGIGQPHPGEVAETKGAVGEFLKDKVPEETVAEGVLKPLLTKLGIEKGVANIGLTGALEALGVGAAGLVGGVAAGVFMNSKPTNEGESEALRAMHEKDPAWQEMLQRQRENPYYSPLHDDPRNLPPHLLDPVIDDVPRDPVG